MFWVRLNFYTVSFIAYTQVNWQYLPIDFAFLHYMVHVMDWNLLRVFLAIADKGSLAGAAKELNINHSTVFRQLNSLEKQTGARLFERLNTGYQLTEMGAALLTYATRINNEFSGIERTIVGQDTKPSGRVRITTPNNIAYHYLPDYIYTFNQTYPDIHVEVLVSNSMVDMSSRDADIAIRATANPPEHLVGRQVARLDWSMFGSQLYAQKFGLPTNVASLADHVFIGLTGALNHLPAHRWLEALHQDNILTRSDDLNVVSNLVKSGQGLALLPEDQNTNGVIKLFTVEDIEPTYLWLLTHPELRHSERIKLVMTHLAQSLSAQWNVN